MIVADIKYYKALADNGGAISTNEVQSGVLNSLLKNVSPTTTESGGVIFTKLFIKNTNATDTAYSADVCLGKYADGEDDFVIFSGTPTDTTATFVDTKVYGIASADTELDRALKTFTISTKNANAVDIFASGDKITFIDKTTNIKIAKATIDTVTNTEIKVIEDIPASFVLLDSWVSNTIKIGDFLPNEEVAIWLKQKVKPFTTPMENPADSQIVLTIFDGVV